MRHGSRAEVMTFLNEISADYPAAISLAAGRPTDAFASKLGANSLVDALTLYAEQTQGMASLLQYGRTAGLINDLVAAQLNTDDGLAISAERIVLTAGCQEALFLCIQSLCKSANDVLLVCNPTYIGATGAADACGVAAMPLKIEDGQIAKAIEHVVQTLKVQGRTARALYLISDFDNPTGHVISRDERVSIIEACLRNRIVVLEDNPYGQFRFDGVTIPPMAALDEGGCVVYLSTYSKTLCPALRVGAASFPRTLFGDESALHALISEVVQRKSFVSVNTGQISQSLVGGILLSQDCSLRNWVRPALELYRDNRDAMLAQLAVAFGTAETVSWNSPAGGFFLSLNLPFVFDSDALKTCAKDFGVIVMPMSFFALDDSHCQSVRLAFSAVSSSEIELAVQRLSSYTDSRKELYV